MGLLDKFKKKTPRKEYENKVNEARKTINKIDTGLGENANKTIRQELNQKLDDSIIQEYGTPEEKRQLKQRKKQEQKTKDKKIKIHEKIEKAKRMNDKNSIRIYQEAINESKNYPDLTITTYHQMAETYLHIKQQDKAVQTLQECIEFKKQHHEDYTYETRRIEFINQLNHDSQITQLQKEGENLYYASQFNQAIPVLQEAIDLGSTRYQTFKSLSECYIIKRDLDSAANTLNVGIERMSHLSYLHNERHDGLEDLLDNIEWKIETGNFKWDCLPYDSQENTNRIKEAKAILKEDEEKGVMMLEDIINNDTFTNTAYYTLYKIYNKDKRYDDCVRICDKAIDVLGYFSKDKLEKWSGYRDNVIGKME